MKINSQSMSNTPTSIGELRTLIASGKRQRFVFFWGHKPGRKGAIGAECLSQWYAAPFVLSGDRYPTSEHYMMAEKARLFADEEVRARILKAGSPGAAKALGREVRGFREEAWTAERFEIVVRANLAKFSQNSALAAFLLGTKSRVLVEASPNDRIWGIGVGASESRAQNPLLWRGENLLGFALMAVRAQLSDPG